MPVSANTVHMGFQEKPAILRSWADILANRYIVYGDTRSVSPLGNPRLNRTTAQIIRRRRILHTIDGYKRVAGKVGALLDMC